MGNLVETIWIKYILSVDEIRDLAIKMARAEATISEKVNQLESVSATIEAEITAQEGILHSCAEKIRSGYEMRPRDAVLSYENGMVKCEDKETGEILEERPMTQSEQLWQSHARIDAEDIIKQARNEED